MEPLNVEEDFLEALQHHPSFLSEFLIHKQQKSGWSKAAYLKTMEGELSRHKSELHLLKNKAKVKTPDIDASLIGKPLDKLTNGKVKEYFTMRTQNKTPLLNADALETFGFYLKKAWTFDEPEPVYSNLQIISFAVSALEFILDEFKIQVGIKQSAAFYRNPPKGFKPTTTDGKPVYLIYNYLVATPAPVFDYYLFEDNFRSLLLNSQHPERLTKLATTLYKMSEEIVSLWNEKLSLLEDLTDETVLKTVRPTSYNIEKRNFTIYRDLHPFIWSDKKPFSNYQLAFYAASVGHLVADEVLGVTDEEKENILKVTETKPAVASYAIKHIYWGKHDKTKIVTKTNRKIFADNYGISEITFFDYYGKFYEKKNRLSLPEDKREQKNSVMPFIKKFEDAALMLQAVCKPAYEELLIDIDHLKTKYQAYLD